MRIAENVTFVSSFTAATTKTTPPFVDFTGKWNMDLESSDKLKPLLTELGAPWILIPIIERLKVKQEIDGKNLHFIVMTKLKTDDFILSVDESTVCPSPTGGLTKTTTRWIEVDDDDDHDNCGGYALESTQIIQGKDGDDVIFVTSRTLEENGLVLVELCETIRHGETTATCRRILRRE